MLKINGGTSLLNLLNLFEKMKNRYWQNPFFVVYSPSTSVRRDGWVGRRRATGNRVTVVSRSGVRIPISPPTKRELLSTKSSLFVYPSRRLGISSRRSREYHQGRLAALVSHHALACICLRLDDIQCFALMIYRNKLRMIYTPSAWFGANGWNVHRIVL